MQPSLSYHPTRRYYLDRLSNLFRCTRCHEILDATDADLAVDLIRQLEEDIHQRPLREHEMAILQACLALDPDDMADMHEAECFMIRHN